MKLDIFNPWRDLTGLAGRTIQWRTDKKGNVFTTYLRDKETQQLITTGFGTSKESSQQNAQNNLSRIGVEGVLQAIKTGQPVHQSRVEAPKKDIDWRDGANHRYRAQRDLVT